MRVRIYRVSLPCLVLLVACLSLSAAENAPPAPASDPSYQQLRNVNLSGESVSVTNLTLKRDIATFHLRSGTVCFVGPVNGKVTGAVFSGDGNFVLESPIASERASLKLLTKENEFSENFNQAVFRFTDSTHDELTKGAAPAGGGCDAGLLKDTQNLTRHKFRENLEVRLLTDVLSPEPGGYFMALTHGRHYSDKEQFEIDPNLVAQVNFWTYEDNKAGHWLSENLLDKAIPAGHLLKIEHQRLDVTFEKSGSLEGKATADIVAKRNGLRVVPLDLFPSLRVQSVTVDGQPASFIQEDKNDDADFAVILPKTLSAGDKFTVTTVYGGKDAVTNEGGGNYYPVARDDWYPNLPDAHFGHFVLYDMTLRIPKGMKIAATGTLVSETNDGDHSVSVWKSEGPQTVAGFSFGRFKVEEEKLTKPDYLVQSYANTTLPDWAQGLQPSPLEDIAKARGVFHVQSSDEVGALGSMSTTELNKKALAEGELAVQLYTNYFGPSMFKRLQLTQQTACNYGQSWPELAWIPICYYFDTTVRHQLITKNQSGLRVRLEDVDRAYWKVVTPHEVAHQWWGHTIGFETGRDQWMSEGFADFSAALYLQAVYAHEPNRYFDFWKEEREILIERNKEGFRAIDVGPLTMGYRLNSTRAGYDVARHVLYPKGAFILHMIQMMLWDRNTGDQRFRDLMHDFVQTYSGKAASTEDFKAMVEKHMTAEMDLEGNHRMDWFFNEYVYGTALPAYKLDASFGKSSTGDVDLHFKVTQSGVDDKFRMLVPIYLELADGRTVFLGRARLTGNSAFDKTVPLAGIKDTPRRALLNYNYDTLASN